MAWHRSHEASRRLDAIPGVGPVLATALIASIADPKAFRSGRNFSAWIGLVPKQHSSGGKDRLDSRQLSAQSVSANQSVEPLPSFGHTSIQCPRFGHRQRRGLWIPHDDRSKKVARRFSAKRQKRISHSLAV